MLTQLSCVVASKIVKALVIERRTEGRGWQHTFDVKVNN